MRSIRAFLLLALIFPLLISAASTSAAEPAIDFNRDIRPLLFSRCVICHGPDEAERAAGLRLDTAQGSQSDLGGYAAIVPGDVEASELITRVTSDDADLMMPPAGKGDRLKPEEIDRLRRWIEQGGNYAKHWSYEIPVRPALPPVSHPNWPTGAIDFFTLAAMDANGMHPAPAADRMTLARRVAIDLTGLPPTWDDAIAFVRDQRVNAYEIYVDALLSRPAFGERWARVWLDLARYADSAGYADDPPRTIWAYRDYVIQAINDNMPFDQFTVEQIAGDLLPAPTEQQLIATAFHRNTLTNNEGGTNDEEFRNVAIVDRVNTTMAVWMGTTMACAQCHTHKYDPITQDEYFQFFSFFNSTEDADKRDESPLIEIWSDAQLRRKRSLIERIDQLKSSLAAPSPIVDQERMTWLSGFQSVPQWHVPAVLEADADHRSLQISDNGWIQASADPVDKDTYQVRVATGPQTAGPASVTGIRLETADTQAGNFVLSQVRATWAPQDESTHQARYIRVDLRGEGRFLHLAEIEAFSAGVNVARAGTATQSSTYADAVASRVNDGNTAGDYSLGSVQHTAGQKDPWVEIDLGSLKPIDSVVLWNRTDGGESIIQRLNGFSVSLLDENRAVIWTNQPNGPAESKHSFSVSAALEVAFGYASADHEQQGFPAASVIRETSDPKSGWAISPQVSAAHQLTLSVQSPTPDAAGVLTISLVQQSEHVGHLIDRFRLSISSDPQLSRWAALPAPVRELIARGQDGWNAIETAQVAAYFHQIAPALEDQRKALRTAEQQLAAMKPSTSVPVMKELPPTKRRTTKVQLRGNYQSTGDVVHEGTPQAFHPLRNTDVPTRLNLAHWLIDRDNPLTARVIVNRHWEQLFGTGIVETSEEFGSQGELPSHPELLDWMAVEFRDNGWDIKRLIKSIVMSSTYRQSSVTDAEQMAADPANRFVARGPRFRVSAEMVRDQALFISGLLSEKRFGPPVNPPQPELGLKAAFGSATDWQTSNGEDRYRRGLYTTWRRSSPYPSMAQFDAPNREVCTIRRIPTNTPLQALVTLNDPVYVEAAQAFARRMIAVSNSDEDRIRFAFHTALIRPPSANEIQRLMRLAAETIDVYRQSPQQAIVMATDPLGPLPADGDAAEFAAWTVVANVILNLDELLMKP